jgi:hypothetical protein
VASGIWLRLDDATWTRVEALLDRVDQAALDMRPAWRRIVGRFSERARRGFVGRWKPLDPRYAKWKARHAYGPSMMMRLTGTLYEALTTPQTADLTSREATIGVETRGARGAWGDLSYIEVANSQRPVWRNLTRHEQLAWGEEVLVELEHAMEGTS